MGKKDFITLKGAQKFLTGEKIFSKVSKKDFLEEVNKLLQEQPKPKEELPLKLKVQFFCDLRDSGMYPLFIEWFEKLLIDDQFNFFFPKESLEEGTFALIESYWDDSPENKTQRIIFVALGVVGELLGVELNPINLSIVEGLQKSREMIVTPPTGGGLHHELVAVI